MPAEQSATAGDTEKPEGGRLPHRYFGQSRV
jgi:hypothetical protein